MSSTRIIAADYLRTNKTRRSAFWSRVLHEDKRTRRIRSVPEKRRRALIGADLTSAYVPESRRRTGCDRGILPPKSKRTSPRAALNVIQGIGNPENLIRTTVIDHLGVLTKQKGGAGRPAPPPVAAALCILASGSSTATAPGALETTVPAGRKTATGRPARSRRQSDGRLPRRNLNPGIPPRRPVPQPTQQRPVQRQTAAASGAEIPGSADRAGRGRSSGNRAPQQPDQPLECPP